DLLQNTRLVLLTSIGKQGDAKRFENAGYSAFLSKPVEENVLHDCIKMVLSLKNGENEGDRSIITRYVIEETKKHSRTILVVEDQETNLITAKALIGKQGYQTEFARNGIEAVEKHRGKAYDLILMDCQMPKMDGFEATRQIRANEKELGMERIPIVAMTGNAFKSDRDECIKAGMDDFMSKPVEPEILAQKIKSNFKELRLNPEPVQDLPENTNDTKDHVDDTKESIEDFLDNLPVEPDESELELELDSMENDQQPELLPNDEKESENDDNTGSLPVFDRKKMLERFGGDKEIMQVVLESFSTEAPELINNLKDAVDKEDVEGIRSNSHSLKGSAANVNAELLRQAALNLELDAKNHDVSNAKSKFEIIKDEYERFTKESVL
ncbi:MAG: response regulator, partial [Desulfobacteraceae bacterium]|nr:response regulator [Desulfobacteraceae bacterium]